MPFNKYNMYIYILSSVDFDNVDIQIKISGPIHRWQSEKWCWQHSHVANQAMVNLVIYRKTSNISRTFIGNKIVDNSDIVGASPVGAAPTTSSFST